MALFRKVVECRLVDSDAVGDGGRLAVVEGEGRDVDTVITAIHVGGVGRRAQIALRVEVGFALAGDPFAQVERV